MPFENARSRSEAQIRALLDSWARAMRAKDVDGVMARYAPEAVVFDLAPPLISTGADAEHRRRGSPPGRAR